MIQAQSPAPVLHVEPGRPALTWAGRLWRFCVRQPLGAVGATLVILLVATGAAAPLLAPYGYAETNVRIRLQPPTSAHVLGADDLGRDILSRIIYGARSTIYVSFGATVVSIVTATAVGVVSAYKQGWIDSLIQRFVDIWQAFPLIIIALVSISIFGGGVIQLILVLGLLTAAGSSRVVRSKALSIQSQPFIEAARTMGATDLRIVLAHILPNVVPTVMVLSAVRLGAIVVTEASLSFLGFGIPPPFPTWGQMLQASLRFTATQPLLAVWPGLAISLAVFAYNMLGDALRDELDPRLRRT